MPCIVAPRETKRGTYCNLYFRFYARHSPFLLFQLLATLKATIGAIRGLAGRRSALTEGKTRQNKNGVKMHGGWALCQETVHRVLPDAGEKKGAATYM